MASYSWNHGSAANQWATQADWTNITTGLTGVVPTATDTAIIAQTGTYSITWTGKGAAATVPVGAIQLDAAGATLSIQSGRTLAVTNAGTLDRGTLTEAGGLTLGTGFIQDGGILSASGTMSAGGVVSLIGGSSTVLAGTLTISAGGLAIGANGTISTGTLTVLGGVTSIIGGTTLSAGRLTVTNSGTVSAGYLTTDTLTVSGGTFSESGNNTEIVVNGLASFTGGSATIATGTFYDTSGGLLIANGAAFAQSGGNTTVVGATTLTASSATISGGTFYVTTGGFAISNGAVLNVNGGSATITGPTFLSASSEILSLGTFYVTTGGLSVSNNASLAVTGGLETIAGGITIANSNVSVSGGTFFASLGGIAVDGGGTLSVNGGLARAIGGVTLSTGGTIGVTSGTLKTDTLAISGGTISASGGTLTVTGAADVAGGGIILSSGTTSFGSLALGGAITLGGPGVVLDASVGGIDLGATGIISGQGAVKGTISDAGTILATGGRLDLTGNVASSIVTMQVGGDAGATLELDGTVAPGTMVTFLNSGSVSTGTVYLGNAAAVGSFAIDGTIAGMATGSHGIPTDVVDLGGITAANVASSVIANGGTTVELLDAGHLILASFNLSASVAAGTAALWTSDGSTGTDVFLNASFVNNASGPTFTVCFAAGSRILTNAGEVRVEDLAAGDIVITLENHQRVPKPVKWIGHRRLDVAAHPRPALVAPVRIRRGAVGENLPHRDLVVSPDHCLFHDGKLVPAKLLINDMTIVQERDTRVVTYYHVELDCHAVLLAEGLPVESYLDTGNRAFFANAGLALVLHPEFHVNAGLRCWETDACAPLAAGAEAVRPIWNQLAERAAAMGHVRPTHATTRDTDLHLVADGRVVRPISVRDGRHVFMLPTCVDAVRLVSRSDVPSYETAYLDDWRPLGVAVSRIVVRSPSGFHDIPPDHPSLSRGWHAAEFDGHTLWRWTDGNAVIPIDAEDGPIFVEVQVQIALEYRLAA